MRKHPNGAKRNMSDVADAYDMYRCTVAAYPKANRAVLGQRPRDQVETARAIELYEESLSRNAIEHALWRGPKTVKAALR